MNPDNALSRAMRPFARLPAPLRARALTLVFGRVVPFVGTAGLKYEEVSTERVVVSLANRRRVQNHIHGVHAAAMALLAETATGFVVGLNLQDDKVPLIKSLHVDYKRRAQGSLRAVATLDVEQRERLAREPKGEVLVPIVVTDESGESPIVCQMVWAWVTKKA